MFDDECPLAVDGSSWNTVAESSFTKSRLKDRRNLIMTGYPEIKKILDYCRLNGRGYCVVDNDMGAKTMSTERPLVDEEETGKKDERCCGGEKQL